MIKEKFLKEINKIFSINIRSFKLYEILALYILIIAGSILQSWHFLTSNRFTSEGVEFGKLHDALWHLSLINELDKSFPPQHPGIAGVRLTNYHYLSDFFWMLVHKISNLSPEATYFYLAAPLVSALFIISAYFFSRQIIKTNWGAIGGAVFVIFGGSFAYLIPIIMGRDKPWSAQTFMLDQPFDQLVNIHAVLAFSIFLISSTILSRYLEKGSNRDAIISGLLFGFVTAIKAYTGVVVILGLIAASVLEFIILRKKKLLYPTLIATILFFIIISIITNRAEFPFAFQPGWLLDRMVEDSDRFYNLKLVLVKQYYMSSNNVFAVFLVDLMKVILYLIGNLGIRILGLVWLIKKLFNIRKLREMDLYLFTTITISLSLPLIYFIKSSPYDVVQFGQYALILLSVLTIKWISGLRISAIAYLVLLIFLIPTTVKTFLLNLEDRQIIPIEEYHALQIIKLLPEDSIILTPPESDHKYLMKIPGISGRRTYFSGEKPAQLTNTPYLERIEYQDQFFSGNITNKTHKQRKNMLENAKITHIFSNQEESTMFLDRLEKSNFPLDLIFKNQDIVLYQVL